MANAILCQQFGVVIRGVSLSRYSNDLRVTTTRCRYKGRELQWGKSVSAGRCRYKGGVVIWGVVIWVCVLYAIGSTLDPRPIIPNLVVLDKELIFAREVTLSIT